MLRYIVFVYQQTSCPFHIMYLKTILSKILVYRSHKYESINLSPENSHLDRNHIRIFPFFALSLYSSIVSNDIGRLSVKEIDVYQYRDIPSSKYINILIVAKYVLRP